MLAENGQAPVLNMGMVKRVVYDKDTSDDYGRMCEIFL